MTYPADGYDIIGDVHGCAAQLEALLVELGYQIADGTGEYRHPRRQTVFVGDLIDRGGEQLRVLEQVGRCCARPPLARPVTRTHRSKNSHHLGAAPVPRRHPSPDDSGQSSDNSERCSGVNAGMAAAGSASLSPRYFRTLPETAANASRDFPRA
jgi:hypothetical protein